MTTSWSSTVWPYVCVCSACVGVSVVYPHSDSDRRDPRPTSDSQGRDARDRNPHFHAIFPWVVDFSRDFNEVYLLHGTPFDTH